MALAILGTIGNALKSTRILSAAAHGREPLLNALTDAVDSALSTAFPVYAAASSACETLEPTECTKMKRAIFEEILDRLGFMPVIDALVSMAGLIPSGVLDTIAAQVNVLSDAGDLLTDPSLENLVSMVNSIADIGTSVGGLMDNAIAAGDWILHTDGKGAIIRETLSGDPAALGGFVRLIGFPGAGDFIEDNLPQIPTIIDQGQTVVGILTGDTNVGVADVAGLAAPGVVPVVDWLLDDVLGF
jgi:hypothetical protein